MLNHLRPFAQAAMNSNVQYAQNTVQPMVFFSRKIWDPVIGRLDPELAPHLVYVLALAAIFCLLGMLILPTVRLRPKWLTAFVVEHEKSHDELQQDVDKSMLNYLTSIRVIATFGLFSQLLKAFWPPTRFQELLHTTPWLVIAANVSVYRDTTFKPSLIFLFFTILVVESVLAAEFYVLGDWSTIFGIIAAVLSLLGTIICLNMPFRDPNRPTLDICPTYEQPTCTMRSPEDNLTPWQFATFSWMNPLISRGTSKQLNDEDVWKLSYQFQHTQLHQNFKELQGSVIRRLLQANGMDLLISTLLGIAELLCQLSLPLLLQQLLQSMENPDSPVRASITYAALSLIVRLISTQCAVLGLWYSRRAYERSRGEMITMLHEKTLSRKIIGLTEQPAPEMQSNGAANPRSSKPHQKNFLARSRQAITSLFGLRIFKHVDVEKEAKNAASKGKILNLMRNDVYEVAQRFWEFQNLLTKPLGLVWSMIFVWRLIGWPSLLGILVVLVSQLLDALAVRKLLKWERLRRITTDTKLQKVSQFVEAIRHLRWYGWQNAWLDEIMEARRQELHYRVVTQILTGLLTVVNVFASNLFPVAVFFAYTALAKDKLRIDIAFPALQLFTMLQSYLRDIPDLITVLLRASIAVGRINDFMKEEDVDTNEILMENREDIELSNGSFSWPGHLHPILKNIDVRFLRGLNVVFGEVAAGKTALLQAILGELDERGGSVRRPDCMVGFCSQMPWLQNMSIRDNILFSLPYDEVRYQLVLEACALLPDLAKFKHGDLSDIGENGIGLSGGQKSRVALARAVYSDARILLLDDPISALDYQTSKTIVEKCLLGPLMENRIIILVTHRVELCRSLATQVFEMSQGKLWPVSITMPKSSIQVPQELEFRHEIGGTEKLENENIPDKFIEEEHRSHGGVLFSVYWTYIKAGKLRWWTVMLVLLSLNRLRYFAQSWFLKEWGEAYQTKTTQLSPGFLKDWPDPEQNIRPWLIGFLLLGLGSGILALFAQIFMIIIIFAAGRQMFRDLMHRVAFATFRFYDITPVGRLMNRMTSDINTVDGNISGHFQGIAFQLISWISSLIVIASVTPVFLIFSALLTLAYILIFLRFLPTSQSLRRLEMVSLSPLMSNFGALLDGLMTVRAFRVQYQFQKRVIAVTDAFQRMDHFYWTLQAWLMYRFDALSAFSTFALTLIALFTKVSPGLTAFVLIASANFVDATHSLCRRYGQLQMDFVSVERVVELLDLDLEPPGSIDPPAWWPSFVGDVVFKNVTIRYAKRNEAALQDVTFRIKGGSTTAIIGRTGSGKSTLALALLATINPEEGSIRIDDIDISVVNKQSLRSRVTFLAQDPILFPGSMRQNLDPLNEHTDEDCSTVLQRICGRHGWTIETHVDTGGKNLSQGQRQLVGLARAVLRRSAIIILDEATASIDMQTSMEIQHILREEMAESTVITIAHRLEAVANADYCIELSHGQILRQGSASEILQMPIEGEEDTA